MKHLRTVLVSGSLALHVGAYVGMALLPKEKKTDTVAIALAEAKKKEEADKPKPPEPPPPPKVDPPKQKAAAQAPKPDVVKEPEPAPKAEPPKEAPPPAGDAPAAMEGFADLGLAMGGGGGGMAIPTGKPAGGTGSGKPATAKPVAKTLDTPADECAEVATKPKLDAQTQPAYTAEGRQANVEGVVKLELTIDENGRVVNVRVIKGLGFGLDEAAVAAAKQWTFKPAMRCGKAVSAVVKPGIRFQLGS